MPLTDKRHRLQHCCRYLPGCPILAVFARVGVLILIFCNLIAEAMRYKQVKKYCASKDQVAINAS
jgi:hypothetical protein